MPNLDPWVNQSENEQQQQGRISSTVATAKESTKLEKHLLSIRIYNQKQIKPNCHLRIMKIMKKELS